MNRRGLTLAELAIVIVVIGVILGIALPKYGQFREKWRLDSAAQQLVGDLGRARVEAIRRNDVVFLAVTSTTDYDIRFIGARQLPKQTYFDATVPDTVKFAAFGPTLTGPATYTVLLGAKSKNVDLSGAGFASVR